MNGNSDTLWGNPRDNNSIPRTPSNDGCSAWPTNHNHNYYNVPQSTTFPIHDGIGYHDIDNRSVDQTKGVCLPNWVWFSNKCPIDVGCHRPDISNRQSCLYLGTTRYASPTDNKSDIDLVSPSRNWFSHDHTTTRDSSIANSVMGSTNHYRHSWVEHAWPTTTNKEVP